MKDFLKVFWQVISAFAVVICLVVLANISFHLLGPISGCMFMLVVISLVLTWQIRSIQKEFERVSKEDE